jgi:outer membrane lipoprotein SlyB
LSLPKYTQVDDRQAVANEVGTKAAVGTVLGALEGLAVGGGERGVAMGAAEGASSGLASGSNIPTVLRYLTLEFDISSRRGGTQTGRVTKDIPDAELILEEFVDAAIADYIEAALPKKR